MGRFRTLRDLLGKTPLRGIDRGMVEDALTRLRVERGIQPATINRYASLLSIVFKYAVDRDHARDNPVRGSSSPSTGAAKVARVTSSGSSR